MGNELGWEGEGRNRLDQATYRLNIEWNRQNPCMNRLNQTINRQNERINRHQPTIQARKGINW